MPPKSRHVTGWGFQTSWEKLVKAAYIWKELRLFKLVRYRQAKQLAADPTLVNLASLPTEVLQMMEHNIVVNVRSAITRRAPFLFDTGECCEEALKHVNTNFPTFDEWLEEQSDVEDLEEIPATAAAMYQEAVADYQSYLLYAHADSGDCDVVHLKKFWRFISQGDSHCCFDFPCDINDLV